MDPSSSELVRRQFGPAAAGYSTNATHAAGPDLPLLLEAAACRAGDLALDIGTGAGHTAMLVAPHCAHVTAIDITPAMLQQARGNAAARGLTNITVEEADAEALPYAPSSFDLVVSRVSAHHFAHPGRFVSEVSRVLRPNGRFILVDTVAPEDPALDTFCNAVELLRDASHVRDWRCTEWLGMFEAAGLRGQVLHRGGYVLDGASWTSLMRTPAPYVAAIRELFASATPAQRAYFEIRDTPWGWTVPNAIFRAVPVESRLAE